MATSPSPPPVGDSRKSHLFYQSRQRRPRVDRAEGIYIWAEDGRRWIDGSSGAMVVNLGHSNPRVLAAMRAQMDRATFAYRTHFENEPAEELARDLVAHMPEGMDRVFFVSGGSEATESCLKMARQYAVATGQPSRYKVISRFPSYHGSTLGALAVTGYTPLTAPFAPMMQEMPKIPAPTVWRDRDSFSLEERGRRYADLLEAEIQAQGAETVLAFIMEPVGGASTGALVAPDSYYRRVREICDRYGVLLIHDEVMSGVGRCGAMLAGDLWGIRPDLIALSKGFASGYSPLGAMICPTWMVEPVLDAGGFQHGHTYAGNPLACAAGRAVVAELVDRDLCGNAARMGAVLMDRLRALVARHRFIGDVRGRGLLTAMEFVADAETLAPLPPDLRAHEVVVEAAYERGLIVYSRRTRGGRAGDHVMVCPPLIVTEEQIDDIVGRLDDALVAAARTLGL